MEAILASCGFDQKGPSRRRDGLKYRHIPAPSLLVPGLFASNLERGIYQFTPSQCFSFSKLLFHYKASVFSTAICTILAHIVNMLGRFSDEEYRSMKDRTDKRLLESGFYSAIVWIDNMLRDWHDEITPGDACRRIVERRSPSTLPVEPVRRAGAG